MSYVTSNLRKLLKKDVLFQWTDHYEKEFQELKRKVSSDTCFDTTKPVTLQVDASKVGLGATLMQKDSQGRNRPVAFASKSLTPAETRHANIEHEMLAGVFGCMRFHHYLYGREFIWQCDHKPLEDICLKHLSDGSTRLQRLLLKIQPYDFVIKYAPGKDITMADEPSTVSPNEKTEIKGLDVTVHELTPQLSRIQAESIKKTTQQDKTLQLHIQQMLEGWPESCRLPEILRPFWQWRDNLSMEHSCITWKGTFFIPIALVLGMDIFV